nr:hypothetical protein [Streptomyces sp. SID12488]
MCVATNGDKGPALLWPEDAESLPALLRLWPPAELGDGGTASPDGPVRTSAGPAADRLTAALGTLLGLHVVAYRHFLTARQSSPPHASGPAERTLTVLESACRCGLSRTTGGPRRAAAPDGTDGVDGPVAALGGDTLEAVAQEDGALEEVLSLRLRAGDTLFVPRGYTYRLSDVHTPTVLLELVLGDPV